MWIMLGINGKYELEYLMTSIMIYLFVFSGVLKSYTIVIESLKDVEVYIFQKEQQ